MSHGIESLGGLPAVALSIAGSDSGAGAGIQADLKTFAAMGVYGLTALTLVTAQSTSAVDLVHVLEPEVLKAQLDCLARDFNISAAKTGALGSPGNISVVREFAAANPMVQLVVDPVTISKHGFPLADRPTLAALRTKLLPIAAVVTPNLHEAAALLETGPLAERQQIERAAHEILALGCGMVVVKGGHRLEDAADFLCAAGLSVWIEGPRLDTPNTHGTGCTFSAAITALLSLGQSKEEAVRRAKEYITGALASSQSIGLGINPVNHFWAVDPEFGVHFPAPR